MPSKNSLNLLLKIKKDKLIKLCTDEKIIFLPSYKNKRIVMETLLLMLDSNTTSQEFEKTLRRIPRNYGELELSLYSLQSLNVEEITQAFRSIPGTIKSFIIKDLFWREDIADIIDGLPSTIEALKLLSLGDTTDFLNALRAIQPNVKTLNLSENKLNNLGRDLFTTMIECLPDSITALDLSRNSLGSLDPQTLINAVRLIPRSVKHLKLSECDLRLLSEDTLNQIASLLPESLISLDLSINDLSNKNLSRFFSSMPQSLKFLNLSHTDLLRQKPTDMEEIFSSLPRDLEIVDLSLNDLDSRSQNAMLLLQSFKNIYSLNLSDNDLNRISSNEIINIINLLPNNILSLSLSGNDLGHKTPKELIRIFKALPRSLKTLDLSYNDFATFDVQSLVSIINAIPTHVEKIKLQGNYLISQNRQAEQIQAALIPYANRLDMSRNVDTKIQRSVASSEYSIFNQGLRVHSAPNKDDDILDQIARMKKELHIIHGNEDNLTITTDEAEARAIYQCCNLM